MAAAASLRRCFLCDIRTSPASGILPVTFSFARHRPYCVVSREWAVPSSKEDISRSGVGYSDHAMNWGLEPCVLTFGQATRKKKGFEPGSSPFAASGERAEFMKRWSLCSASGALTFFRGGLSAPFDDRGVVVGSAVAREVPCSYDIISSCSNLAVGPACNLVVLVQFSVHSVGAENQTDTSIAHCPHLNCASQSAAQRHPPKLVPGIQGLKNFSPMLKAPVTGFHQEPHSATVAFLKWCSGPPSLEGTAGWAERQIQSRWVGQVPRSRAASSDPL
ncbi:predicted protein [Chaetomium globosum CBS 148.51]|uniref:Uncharacterized protein n=1 Tax=Chaetomium globosum (strain ATCC 6205 / CBS 148.51 / DSM 1962 / NBRC 6347 / NRRL 1970) TaxID=306901 RepID=Q2H249_CHAGB|nr:uncharacterized protein CHGG_04147 [Chaetomium globosum CBS 148.51]EAQ87528.1 predicted protein [Chaetomium globosum CBS 148.51]